MTTVADPHRERSTPPQKEIQLRVSAYDNVASLLISLIILIGVAVAILFIIWLTATLVFRPKAVPVKLVENVAGRGDHAEGFERDLEAPGMEEMPELAEPQLEAAVEAVTDAVTSVAASMDVLNTDSTITGKGEGGMGDSRPPGPEGEGDDIIPRWERWEIRWASNSINAYAAQLDFFKIELGAAGGAPQVDYALHLTQSRPQRRSGPPQAEKRLYMTWRDGTALQAFDRTLLSRAGINTNNRLTMQFFPEEVEDRLAWIEMENGKGRSVKEFLRTVFAVKAAGGGYEFEVVEQRFRPKPP